MQVNNKSAWILIFLTLPFLGLVALMVSAGTGQVATPPQAAKVHQVQVAAVSIQPSYSQSRLAYGRVEANKQANAGFELAGTLLEVLVDEGDSITQGQLLARLDVQRLDARMLELNAALARAEADARLAKLSEKRVAELVRKNLESTQRLDEVRESTLAANALVTEIQARKNSLEVELQKSEIRAPYAGSVLARPVDPGTVVAAGQTILTLQQNAAFEARIALSANDAFRLEVGNRYSLQAGEQKLPAVLKSIAKQRRLDTRTVNAIFALEDNAQGLLPGDLIAFSYHKEISEAGGWIPREALNSGVRGLWTVFTVEKQGEQKLSAKAVEVLYGEPDRVFVRGALKPGDLLVVNGTQRLVPDQVVQAKVVEDRRMAMRP